MDAMQPEAFERLLTARWSCRAFRPDPVARSTIEAILAAAQRTASWNNVQPWQLIVLSGAAVDRFRAFLVAQATSGDAPAPQIPFPTAYEGVYKDRRRACGFQLYDAVGIARGDKAAYARQTLRNFELFDAPHAAVLTTEDALGSYGVLDCGAYLTNVMNAAQSHGVATIAQGALAVHAEAIHGYFNLPAHRRVVCGLSFGYPKREHPVNGYRVPRAELDEVVTWCDA